MIGKRQTCILEHKQWRSKFFREAEVYIYIYIYLCVYVCLLKYKHGKGPYLSGCQGLCTVAPKYSYN